ncbi:MAG: SRPBCC family protein [Candidatus Anammoxibacter sp.]
MKRTFKFISVFIFLIGCTLFAKQEIITAAIAKGNVIINAPKESVWEVISNLESVHLFDPEVKNSFYISNNRKGVGTSRQCDLSKGYVKERVTKWDEGNSMAIEVYENKAMPIMKSIIAEYNLENFGIKTIVTMTMRYKLKGGPLGSIFGFFMRGMVKKKIIKRHLEGLKHYTEEISSNIATIY